MKLSKSLLVTILFSSFFGVLLPRFADAQPKLYFTDVSSSSLIRSNLDGGNAEDLVTGLTYPHGVTLDTTNRKIYYTDTSAGTLSVVNFDGTSQKVILSNLQSPGEVVYSSKDSTLYYLVTPASAGPALTIIHQVSIDGSGDKAIVTTNPGGVGSGATHFALDSKNGKLYWTDSSLHKVFRANSADGANSETIIDDSNSTFAGPAYGIALDVAQNKIYYCASTSIVTANLDGTNESLLTTISDPCDAIALDLTNKKIYFATSDSRYAMEVISLSDLSITTLFPNLNFPAIAVDPTVRNVDPTVTPDTPIVSVAGTTVTITLEKYKKALLKSASVAHALREIAAASKSKSKLGITYQIITTRTNDGEGNVIAAEVKKRKSKRNTLTLRNQIPGTYTVTYHVLITKTTGSVTKVVKKTPFSKSTGYMVTSS